MRITNLLLPVLITNALNYFLQHTLVWLEKVEEWKIKGVEPLQLVSFLLEPLAVFVLEQESKLFRPTQSY